MNAYDEVSFAATDDRYFLLGAAQTGRNRDGNVVALKRIQPYEGAGFEVMQSDRRDAEAAGAVFTRVAAVYGVVNLLSGPYLAIVGSKQMVGKLYTHTIWRMGKVELFPLATARRHLSEAQIKSEDQYLAMLEASLSQPAFYFSFSYDITHTLHRMHVGGESFYSQGLLARADTQFVWNNHFLEPLLRFPEMAGFLVPIMHGFVGFASTTALGTTRKAMELALLSRRSTFRAGTRFNRRGVDDRGKVANYVETELITHIDSFYTSFTQTRGSIPLYWGQTPNIRYKPAISISGTADHNSACKSHFAQENRRHGRHTVVNLINNSGHEGALCAAFANCMYPLEGENLRYVYFNFHKECAKLRFDRLSILMEKLATDLAGQGSFISEQRGDVVQIHSFQQGVFRANCIDCLDRTNVVQSMVARRALDMQLKRVGILPPGEGIHDLAEFELVFKSLWTDHGDQLASQYGGSGALKADFTRTGRRTFKGILHDGVKAMERYYRNNFADGARQDSIDLLLGNYCVKPGEGVSVPCPLSTNKVSPENLTLLALLVAGCTVLLVALCIPATRIVVWTQVYYWIAWCLVLLYGGILFRARGTEFVDNPELIKPLKGRPRGGSVDVGTVVHPMSPTGSNVKLSAD